MPQETLAGDSEAHSAQVLVQECVRSERDFPNEMVGLHVRRHVSFGPEADACPPASSPAG